MRIAISQVDVNDGRLTKISRILKKIWPRELTHMQAQNVLAELLGYRNLHDIQSNLVDTALLTDLSISRRDLQESVAWKAHRQHGLNVVEATSLSERLHLHELDIDKHTFEAHFDLNQSQASWILDEGNSLTWGRQWHPMTPTLLAANVPPYETVILPDRRMFWWSRLIEMVNLLPKDYVSELALESRYQSMLKQDIETHYIRHELLPAAYLPLTPAIKESKLRPADHEIHWLFTRECTCIGRALFNKAVGGYIPVIYSRDNDTIFDAIGSLLCGETIEPRITAFSQHPLFVLGFFVNHGGYDFVKDIRLSAGKDTGLMPSDLSELPSPIGYSDIDGEFCFSGDQFVAHGQTYIRHQNWLSIDDVPDFIFQHDDAAAIESRYTPKPLNAIHDVVPHFAQLLFVEASSNFQRLIERAETSVVSQHGIEQLLVLIGTHGSPVDLDHLCDVFLKKYLPLQYESHFKIDVHQFEDEMEAMQQLIFLGEQMKAAIPQLQAFRNSSLGLLQLLCHKEYPGSRNAYTVYAPSSTSRSEIVDTLTYLLYFWSCRSLKNPIEPKFIDSSIRCLVFERVLLGESTLINASDDCHRYVTFQRKIRKQSQFMSNLDQWRRHTARMDQVRSMGEYLYVKEPISPEKPENIHALFSQARSRPYKAVLVTQTLADFELRQNPQ